MNNKNYFRKCQCLTINNWLILHILHNTYVCNIGMCTKN